MKKFEIEVTADLSTLVCLTFEVEGIAEDNALNEAAALAYAKLGNMTNHEKLSLIRHVVENDGTIRVSELCEKNLIGEFQD